jgi:hypothetical protein
VRVHGQDAAQLLQIDEDASLSARRIVTGDAVFLFTKRGRLRTVATNLRTYREHLERRTVKCNLLIYTACGDVLVTRTRTRSVHT